MSATTILEHVPDSEQLSELARYLDNLKQTTKEEGIYKKIQSSLSDASKYGEVLQLILAECDTLFLRGNERDIENAFALLSALLMRQNDVTAKELLNSLLKVVCNNLNDKTQLRLAILANLYNMIPNRDLRFLVFTSLLNFAINSNNVNQIVPLFDSISERLKEWNATNTQKREIYNQLRRAMKDKDKHAEHKYNVKYLSTFDKESADVMRSVAPEVKQIVVNALRISDLYQYDDLFQLDVIRVLEDDEDTKKLYYLLKIFACESLKTFLDFANSNKEFLQSIDLPFEECQKKMSLLSLITLANQYTSEIPYRDVIKELQLANDEEVEQWVIRAVGANLMEAKLDQSRKVITVTGAFPRNFTSKQWKQLAEKLAIWRENVRAILKVVQNAKAEKNKQ
jgi:translation initiation factor 3 subunit M